MNNKQPGLQILTKDFQYQAVPEKPIKNNKPKMQINRSVGDNRHFGTTQPSEFPTKLP